MINGRGETEPNRRFTLFIGSQRVVVRRAAFYETTENSGRCRSRGPGYRHPRRLSPHQNMLLMLAVLQRGIVRKLPRTVRFVEDTRNDT